MSSDSRRRVSEFLEKLVEQFLRSVATAFMAGCTLLIIHGSAQSLTGAEDVGPNDIGAKASVALYYKGKLFCGGVVFEDRYILTAAHCLTDGNGSINIEPDEIGVFYWSSEKAKRDIRKVLELAVNENYLKQEQVTKRLGGQIGGDPAFFPINHEDIAILKIDGTHPIGAVSAVISDIINGYTAEGGDAPPGPDTWYYVYGSVANGRVSYGRLQRALIGHYHPLQRVIPGEKPGIFYRVRQLTIITDGLLKNVSPCSGDSGSGVFLIASDGVEFVSRGLDEDGPRIKLPDGGIKLEQGHPVLVGLLKGVVDESVNSKAECGRDVGSDAFTAVRVDYYHDWILTKTKKMQ